MSPAPDISRYGPGNPAARRPRSPPPRPRRAAAPILMPPAVARPLEVVPSPSPTALQLRLPTIRPGGVGYGSAFTGLDGQASVCYWAAGRNYCGLATAGPPAGPCGRSWWPAAVVGPGRRDSRTWSRTPAALRLDRSRSALTGRLGAAMPVVGSRLNAAGPPRTPVLGPGPVVPDVQSDSDRPIRFKAALAGPCRTTLMNLPGRGDTTGLKRQVSLSIPPGWDGALGPSRQCLTVTSLVIMMHRYMHWQLRLAGWPGRESLRLGGTVTGTN